jgi:hypothetical protein
LVVVDFCDRLATGTPCIERFTPLRRYSHHQQDAMFRRAATDVGNVCFRRSPLDYPARSHHTLTPNGTPTTPIRIRPGARQSDARAARPFLV